MMCYKKNCPHCEEIRTRNLGCERITVKGWSMAIFVAVALWLVAVVATWVVIQWLIGGK